MPSTNIVEQRLVFFVDSNGKVFTQLHLSALSEKEEEDNNTQNIKSQKVNTSTSSHSLS